MRNYPAIVVNAFDRGLRFSPFWYLRPEPCALLSFARVAAVALHFGIVVGGTVFAWRAVFDPMMALRFRGRMVFDAVSTVITYSFAIFVACSSMVMPAWNHRARRLTGE